MKFDEHESQCKRCYELSDGLSNAADLLEIQRKILNDEREAHAATRGAMAADDNRLRDAAIRVWGEHIRGCDTPDEMAEAILALRCSFGNVARRLAAAEECLREIESEAGDDYCGRIASAFLAGGKP